MDGEPGIAGPEEALVAAEEAYGRFDIEAVIAHLSAAVRGFTASGDRCRAAVACARLGDAYATGLGNLTAGRAWFARAMRLIEDEPACLEQGWIAVAAMGCDVDDPAVLLAAAELALDRARRFGDVNLETKALADGGLAHVEAGRIAQGMALLDEAMALACGPANDLDTAAKSVCSFFTACYYSGDFGRASSWTELLRRRGLIGPASGRAIYLSSHCDSVQGTLLMELGRWGEAEETLAGALDAFEAAMPMPAWHPAIALAHLRIRQGRFAEAESLLLGKDQALQALLPAAHLHVARGDHELARAAVRRGLRVIGKDRVRAVELLTLLVDAELVARDLDAARAVSSELADLLGDIDAPALRARAAAARARVLASSGDLVAAIGILEATVDRVDGDQLPWLRCTLLLELARRREQAGDLVGARLDASAAARSLAGLDVVLSADDLALLERLGPDASRDASAPLAPSAELGWDGSRWVVSWDGTRTRLQDSKGLRYLAELVARPGVERHALDLVDTIVGVGDVDRRTLGDAGELLDARARADYRRRIETLRAEIDDACASGRFDAAEARQVELDQLVAQLTSAFGLGGRERRAASAAERARLNVTRAVRAALAKLIEAVPRAGETLDRRIRTGLYCAYEPLPADSGEVRWIVQSRQNGTIRR